MSEDLDLRNFLEKREEEIVRKRAALQRELEDLRSVRATLESRQRSGENQDAGEKRTIKEMVRAVLERNPEGGTSDQIVSWINQTFGRELARPSLTPQLSRLKSDGEVELDEDVGVWSLSYLSMRRHNQQNRLAQKLSPSQEREQFEKMHRLRGGPKNS